MSMIDPRLLEHANVKMALLAVTAEMIQQHRVVDLSTIQGAMGWQWFHASYAMRFHNVWRELGIKPH